MAVTTLPAATASPTQAPSEHRTRALHVAIEVVALVLVAFSPWAFGSVHPLFEFVLLTGVGLLLVLWGADMLIQRRMTWRKCPVALGLGGLFVLGACQLAPLPSWLLQTVSPATPATVAELLPLRPELVRPDEPAPVADLPAGTSLSLYPGATRLAALRLLAVFCLFAVVRNTIASSNALRRLTVLSVLNGLGLALLALLQFFTSPRFTLFWTYPTDGTVFGPFICRNHFSFYINICLGLGLGYLLSMRWAAAARRRRNRYGPPQTESLLQRPTLLWVAAALAVIVSAAFFSLSRGGFVALLGGVLLALVVLWVTSPRGSGVAVWLVTGLLAFGLLAWYGWPQVEARLVSLWASPAQDGRFPVWSNCLPLLTRFPIFGTGYGTFRYVEPLQRGAGEDPDVVYEYAHNDYLEAAVEGGALRLVLSVFLIALVYWLGFRAYRRYRAHATAGLVLGGLVAFTTVVIHSFVDFGLHIPAIAVFVTVLCAHLSALGARRGATPAESDEAAYSVRLGGAGPLLGLGATAILAFVLTAEGWRLSQAERFRLAARNLAIDSPAESRDRQIAYLGAAVSYEPADAALHVALADTHFAAWHETPGGPGVARSHALDAARHYLLARSLCPLLPQPHVRLAALADTLAAADSRANYLRRATRVLPADAHLWYLAGTEELAERRPEEACRSWRESLRASDRFLPDILHAGGKALTTQQWTHDVLPVRSQAVYQAAWLLHPQPEMEEDRRPFMKVALEHFENRSEGLKAKDYHLRARIQEELDQPDDALVSYRLALSRERQQTDWRLEMARLLLRQKQYREAEEALVIVLHEQPANDEVLTLLRDARQGIKEKK
jgi:O-antigen ligase